MHVLRLGIGRVVHIMANVEVEVVFFHDFRLGHEAAIFRQLALVGEDKVDFLDVLGAEFVLVLALGEFAVGIDQQLADELFLAAPEQCGMTVAASPSALRLASMCWTNMRSAFFPVSGHHSRKREGNLRVARL